MSGYCRRAGYRERRAERSPVPSVDDRSNGRNCPFYPDGGSVQTRESLREWLVAQVAEKLAIAPAAVDVTQPVADMGLSSAKSVEISAAINERFALEVSPAVLYDHPTIAELATYLERLWTDVSERAAAPET